MSKAEELIEAYVSQDKPTRFISEAVSPDADIDDILDPDIFYVSDREYNDKNKMKVLKIVKRMEDLENLGRKRYEKVERLRDIWDKYVDKLDKMGVSTRYTWGDILA